MINRERLLERFLRYVQCDSESGNERAFCELIGAELAAAGLQVWRDDAGEKCGSNGWNVYASLSGEGEPLLFSCHLDTVPPGKGIRPVVQDGVIRSSGDTVLGADDKSGVAAVLEALDTVREQNLPHRPVEVLFSICEEIGLFGAKYADYSRFAAKQAIVLDSSKNGSIINRSPASVNIHVTFTGRSAHAGVAPECGRHALKAAAQAVANIPCGYVGDMSVMNVANLLAPGKSNVVPAQASFDMEIRSFEEATLQELLAQSEKAVKDACEAFEVTYTFEVERHSDVLYVPEDSALIQQMQAVFAGLGCDATVERTFGGCDATWLNANGIGAVNTGTGMSEVHGVGEYIAQADLERTAGLVLGMIRR